MEQTAFVAGDRQGKASCWNQNKKGEKEMFEKKKGEQKYFVFLQIAEHLDHMHLQHLKQMHIRQESQDIAQALNHEKSVQFKRSFLKKGVGKIRDHYRPLSISALHFIAKMNEYLDEFKQEHHDCVPYADDMREEMEVQEETLWPDENC